MQKCKALFRLRRGFLRRGGSEFVRMSEDM